MKGDSHFTLFTSASTATSAAPAHSLFGSNLSTLNVDEVVHVQIQSLGGDLRIGRGTLSSQIGLRITHQASLVELKPMRVGFASQLHIVREASTDGSALYNVWLRR